MDLRTWLVDEAHDLRRRLEGAVIAHLPPEEMTERVDGGGVAPVYVLWHLARHHDVAVNAVLRGEAEVLDAHADRVGIATDTWRGLAEAQDDEIVARLDPAGVAAYTLAVCDATAAWLADTPLDVLDTVPDPAAVLDALGTPRDRFSWLYDMWAGRDAAFFVRWEALGHGFNHLGELVALRNRLGHSPF
ncbi:MAG: hypothetical protein D6683_07380 [Actinomyces sp.]|nr:MAG: hypothetical protein D6683_07380 [Actinomyces sp.]